MPSTNDLLFLGVVLLSNIIQCITGFAGTVLAMPVSLMLVGYAVAKPVLNALGAAASVGVIASAPSRLNFGEFTKMLSVMLVGMLAGSLIQTYCDLTAGSLYIMLGVAVIAFTGIGFANEFLFKKPMASLLPKRVESAAALAAKTRSTSLASSLLVTPGKAFCSWMAVWMPRLAAARPPGPLT